MTHTKESILKDVKGIIAEQLDIPVERVHEDSVIKDDLGADSLEVIEICMLVETKYSINVEDEDAEKIRTVGDLVNVVAIRLGLGSSTSAL